MFPRSGKKERKWENAAIMAALVIMYILTVAAVVGTVYIQKGYSLDVGSVSPRRFDAMSNTVNSYATQKLRNEAMDSVLPVYAFDAEVQKNTRERIRNFFKYIEEYRSAKEKNAYALSRVVYNSVSNDEQNKFSLTEEQLNTIDSMDADTYYKFKEAAIDAIDHLMDKEIKTESELTSAINECMDTYFADFAQKRYALASYMLSFTAEPNCFIDVEATETAKRQKADSVEPVYILKNQKIIDEGEIIDDETLSMLKDLGFVNSENGIFDNLPHIIGTVFLVLAVYICVIYFMRYHLFVKSGNLKKIAAIITMYGILIISTMVLRSFHYVITGVLVFTMLSALMTSTRTAGILNAAVTAVCCFMYGTHVEFLIYYTVMGTVTAAAARYSADRTKLIYSVMLSVFLSVFVIAGITLATDNNWQQNIIKDCAYAFIATGFSYIIAIGSLPLFENFFGIVTNVKLLELVNPDRELLRKLLIEAPGTYHHSLIVANLAEAACAKIGANPVLARVGAYYHDIGKLKNPYYFTENIIGKNPHDDFEPQISANIIMNHIKDGLELADKYKLPEDIKKIIKQHHGTSTVRFFYNKAKEIYGEDNINKNDYRYKYELPDTKEAAVVMLADICEASVRSMLTTGKSTEEIENFINSIIRTKVDEHQFVACDISFKELNDIIGAFMEIFNGMYHKRIRYQDDEKKEEEK